MSHENTSGLFLKPLDVRFESIVDLTIHDAHLASAGLLQCDPIATVEFATVRRLTRESGPSFSIKKSVLAQTSKKIFTSTPKFDETLHFTVSDASCATTAGEVPSFPSGFSDLGVAPTTDEVENRIWITFVDSTSKGFLGRAICPFSPYSPSMTPPASPVRVMLQPRNLGLDPADPVFLEDTATLYGQGIDDFGYVNISWKVSLVPLGGAMDLAVDATALVGGDPSLAGPVTLPIGITIKAAWLLNQEWDVGANKEKGSNDAMQYNVSVSFGDAKRFSFPEGRKPLFLTLHTAPHLEALIFSCSSHNMYRPDLSREIAVVVPLPSLATVTSVDRDIHWIAPVRSVWGEDFGMLATTIRLSRRPLDGTMPACPSNATCLQINDPKHQEEFSHVAVDFGRDAPATPFGAYQMLFWESEEHIRSALERGRQREVVIAAQPTQEHIRHLFDVLMGRSILDESVAKVACNVFQCGAPSDLVALQLKKLMVSFAFHCRTLSVLEAVRFLFLAFRSEVEDAIAVEELHFMLQNSLLEKTVDMPEKELRRWVTDLVGTHTRVLYYKDFTTYVLRNFAFWYFLGVPLKIDRVSSSLSLSHFGSQAGEGRSSTAPTFLLQPVSLRSSSPVSSAPILCGGTTGHGDWVSSSSPSQIVGDAATSRDGVTTVYSSSCDRGGRRRSSLSDGRKRVQFQEKHHEVVSSRTSSSSASGNGASLAVWRTFVIRVCDGTIPKAFSVTAHADDKIKDVMKMVEESAGIKAECQQWKLNNEIVLAPILTIGSTPLGIEPSIKTSKETGAALPMSEVWIYEMEENVVIRFFFKEKNKHWNQRFPVKEKVLQVRASVQRQTLIPLSRCTLRLVRNGRALPLQDRHTLSHYSPQSNDLIEVTQEGH